MTTTIKYRETMKGVLTYITCLLACLGWTLEAQVNWGTYPATNNLPTNSWFLSQDWTVASNTPAGMRRIDLTSMRALMDSATPESNTVFVDTAGSDATGTRGDAERPYQTVDAALAVVQSGDVLVIRPGTYTYVGVGMPGNSSSYSENANANLILNGKTNVTILGYGAVIKSSGLGNIMTLTDVTNVVLAGLTFQGGGYNAVIAAQICGQVTLWGTNNGIAFTECTFRDFPNHGILVSQTEKTSYNTRIQDCKFESGGTMNHATLTVDGTGIASTGPGMIVTGCTFDRVTRGIEIEGSGTLAKGPASIVGNVFTNIYNQAIIMLETAGGDGTLLNDISITGNTITMDKTAHSALGQYGITASGGRRIVISGNTVRRANNTGISLAATQAGLRACVISGNAVSECGVNIAITDPIGAIIYDNQITGNLSTGNSSAAGSIIVAGNATLVANNIVADSAGFGIIVQKPTGDDRSTNCMVINNLVRTTTFSPIGIGTDCFETVVRGNNIRYAYGGATISDSGTDTLIETYDSLGTTTNPDIDVSLTTLSDSIISLAGRDFVLGGATNANVVGLKQPVITGPPTKPSTLYEGGTILVDLEYSDFTFRITNDVLEIGYDNIPDTTGTVMSWSGIVTNAHTNIASVQWGDASATSLVPVTQLGTNDVYEFKLESRDSVLRYTYIGPQEEKLPMTLGGTGVDTGIAPGGKDVLGDWSTTQTTNHFPDLASGTVFRFPNSLDPYLGTPASRLSASETNGLVITRRIEMLPASEERVIIIDTNSYALSGITERTTNAAGVPFVATIINWGPDSSNNIIVGTLSTNVAAAGGEPPGTDYTEGLLAAWVMTNASGNITDASGSGYTMTPLGGTFTYQQAGDLEDYSIRNAADSSLVLTNPAAALNRNGSESFTFAARVKVGDAATLSSVAGVWDDSGNKIWRVRPYSGNWAIVYSTNAYDYATSSGVAVTTDWVDLAVVYDASVPSLKFLVDGSATTITLGAELVDETGVLSLGGVMNSGAAYQSATGYYERAALWDEVKTTGFIQEVLALPFDEWAP